MNILSAVISSISDVILLSTQIIVLCIVSSRNCTKVRYTISVIIAAASGFLSEVYFHNLRTSCSFFLLLIYCLRLSILALYAVKSLNVKDGLIVMIIQFLGSTINSAVIALIPNNYLIEFPYINHILLIAIPLCMYISALLIRNKATNKNQIISSIVLSIPTHNYILMFIAIFIESGLIEILSYHTEKVEAQIKSAKIISLLLILCITSLIISLTVNVVYHKYYNNLNQILIKQVKLQLQHYKKREKLNTEIRSFRHDFNNHVKCLESLMNAQRYSEAHNYLEKLTGLMPSCAFLYRTGNYIADAILTEGQEASSADNITINFSGYIPPSIDSIDLCIILSNSLNNAIEACQAISGNNIITVYSNVQQGILVLIVKNPTLYEGKAKDIFPGTTKDDKVSHGFGMANMQRVVAQYDGTMHTMIENGFFTISFTLKL